MSVNFFPIASGSDGNCTYVGTKSTHILIDAGLSGKKVQTALEEEGLSGDMIDAIFITHEHQDHVIGVGILSRRFNIPIYATEETWAEMERLKLLGKVESYNKFCVYDGQPCAIQDIKITPFQIPHDASQPVGYAIDTINHKVSVVTDIGHITTIIREYMVNSDIILVESNHDVEMLKNGPYPIHLKERVLGELGHLSNENCGALLDLVIKNSVNVPSHICLGHLSKENNHPDIALETVANVLNTSSSYKMDMSKLSVANPYGFNKMISLG